MGASVVIFALAIVLVVAVIVAQYFQKPKGEE